MYVAAAATVSAETSNTVKSCAEGKYLGKYKAQCLILYGKSPKIPPSLLSAPYLPVFLVCCVLLCIAAHLMCNMEQPRRTPVVLPSEGPVVRGPAGRSCGPVRPQLQRLCPACCRGPRNAPLVPDVSSPAAASQWQNLRGPAGQSGPTGRISTLSASVYHSPDSSWPSGFVP